MMELCPSEQLSTAMLIQELEREIQDYRDRRTTTTPSAFELFRRALVLRDEQAWVGMFQLYSNLVSAWILPLMAEVQVTRDDLGAMINTTFAKFVRGVTAQKFADFSSVEPLLKYLKLCAQSVARDEMRLRRYHQCEQAMDAIEDEPLMDDPAEAMLGHLEASEVWEVIRQACRPDELLILLYNCALGWPARDLQESYPAIFPSVDEVYRIRRNAIARLQRNRQLKALLVAGRLIA